MSLRTVRRSFSKKGTVRRMCLAVARVLIMSFFCRAGSKQSEKETIAHEKKGLDKLSSWIG